MTTSTGSVTWLRELLPMGNPARWEANHRIVMAVVVAFVPVVIMFGLAPGFMLAACAVSFAAWRFGKTAQAQLVLTTAQLALAASKLEHQAFHDSLTGLANRALFRDRVDHAVNRGARSSAQVAVLFVDLDNFKLVNDTLGHAAGDEVLEVAARRLADSLRPADTIARLGGDEFAILLEDISEEEDATRVAERIVTAMESPIPVHGKEAFIHASVGVVLGRSGADSVDELSRRADLAMYGAKLRGKGRYEVYSPALHDAMVGRMDLTSSLTHALELGQLEVHYQPIIDLRNGRIASVEALARWTDPQRGVVSPAEFIPLAEETGLIRKIDGFVIAAACRKMQEWRARHGERAPGNINVNLSARSLRDVTVLAEIRSILEREGLPPQSLTIEITESMLVDGIESDVLVELKNLGVKLAVDDFGTGYSSLNYLRRFPIDMLKIDGSFIKNLGGNRQDLALAQAMINIGEGLSLQVVAEGVETHVQLTELRSMGAVYAQGFLFSPPLPADQTELLFEPWGVDSRRETSINGVSPELAFTV